MAMNEPYDDATGQGHDERDRHESRHGRHFEDDAPRRRRHGEYKSTVAAAFLSCLPGAGQIYVGAYGRGFAHVLTFAGIVTLLANGHMRGLEPLLGIFLAFFVIYNLVDAIRLAQAYNNAVDMGLTSAATIQVNGTYGRGVGIGLIVVGTFLLLETRLGLDMRWLEDWWPVGIIVAGVWIVRSSMSREDSEGKG
jgi:TM2 domain-containing membrane protein YozV